MDPIVLGLASPVLALVTAFVVQKMARGAQREMYPAQVIADLREEVDRLRKRLDSAEAREHLRDDYIHSLREHISQGKKAPPPPWPEGLTS